MRSRLAGAWVLGLAACTLCAAQPLFAERAVGLEARGVDPRAALHNPHGLDVRDALGRPVSARLVRQQIKAAAAEAAASPSSYSSALPQAKAWTRAMEMLEAPRDSLRLPWSGPLHNTQWALPVAPKQTHKIFLVNVFLFALLTCRAYLKRLSKAAGTAAFTIPLVLRC